MRIKLYRFREEQWKERGIGNCRIMRSKEDKRIRFVMRQEKTLKPVANFICKFSSHCFELTRAIQFFTEEDVHTHLLQIVSAFHRVIK